MIDKVCSKCGRLLPVEQFHWTKNLDGLRYRRGDCIQCCALASLIRRSKKGTRYYNTYKREYRRANIDKVRVTEKRSRLRCRLRKLGL